MKNKSNLPKNVFKIYTIGNWITHRIDEVMSSNYDPDLSNNLGLWTGIIGSVTRRILSDSVKTDK